MMRNQGRPNAGTFIHPELGMNFRITEVQASIGLAQIAKMDKLVARRLELWKQYEEKLRNHEEITFIKQESFSTLIPFRFIIKSRHKDRIMQHLESKGIQTRSCFYPLNLQPQLKHYRSNDCTISKKSYDEGMCLPVHHNISDSDVEFISAAILESVNAI
jgi:perosamine synthetase